MIGTGFPRVRTALRLTLPCAIAVLLAGCVSYSPSRLSAMSTVDLCELSQVQAKNLSDETKRALQTELQRRKDSCNTYAAALAERRQAFMQREMYGRHDAP